jgi:hypothetical protein
MMKMCAAVGATYHLDTVGVDGISRKSSLRQINYVVYVGDNTAGGRQVGFYSIYAATNTKEGLQLLDLVS